MRYGNASNQPVGESQRPFSLFLYSDNRKSGRLLLLDGNEIVWEIKATGVRMKQFEKIASYEKKFLYILLPIFTFEFDFFFWVNRQEEQTKILLRITNLLVYRIFVGVRFILHLWWTLSCICNRDIAHKNRYIELVLVLIMKFISPIACIEKIRIVSKRRILLPKRETWKSTEAHYPILFLSSANFCTCTVLSKLWQNNNNNNKEYIPSRQPSASLSAFIHRHSLTDKRTNHYTHHY